MERKDGRKKRLDLLLVEKGLVNTRSRARGEIMAGHIFVDGKRQDKAGVMLSPEALIELQVPNPMSAGEALNWKKPCKNLILTFRIKLFWT